MRKVIFFMSVSLDGFFEGPDHDLGWQTIDEELHQHFNDWLTTTSAFLDGRVSYELMASYWPTADQDPGAPPQVVEFAGIWREMPKVVYSRTLQQSAWNSTIVREVVPEQVAALKAQPGGDMVVGGADLAATFLGLGLIDEIHLYVHPVAIGWGRPLFPPGVQVKLRLIETRSFGSGVVLLRYERL